MRLKPSPTQEIALFLTVYAGLAIGFNAKLADNSWNTNLVWHALTTVGFAWILLKLIETVTQKKRVASNTITSGWILFLVLHPPIPTIELSNPATWEALVPALLATLFLMGFKTVIQFKKMPIFNPVVGGLLTLAALTYFIPSMDAPFISWWGASFQGWVALSLILVWIVLGLKKWRKTRILLSFLCTYLLLLIAFKTEGDTIKFIVKDATIYFMAGVMLIEPKTSPLTALKQVAYGVVAAVGMTAFTVFGWPYFDLAAIALANGLNLGFKIAPSLKLQPKK